MTKEDNACFLGECELVLNVLVERSACSVIDAQAELELATLIVANIFWEVFLVDADVGIHCITGGQWI